MTVLFFECLAGASGDMIVGALVDLGVPPQRVRRAVAGLKIPGLRVSFRKVRRGGLSATQFVVRTGDPQTHRGLRAIRRLLRESDLPPAARRTAEDVFHRLCTVEAAIHDVPVEKIHLHEVGAVDSIVDVVAAAVCLDALAPSHITVSPLPTGSGSVLCEHGTLPVPAPATLELLRGCPIYGGPVAAEMVTPTGAAILTTVATEFGPLPPMRLRRSGQGAGTRDDPGLPNVLRVLEGEMPSHAEGQGEVIVVEANIDDMNPQLYDHLMERLYEAGALEVFYSPVHMKKNRPGVLVTAIARERAFDEIARALFRESTTIGIRQHHAYRRELERETVRVRTPYGSVTLKVSRLDGNIVQISPEYEDCRRCARRHRVPLHEVQTKAVQAFRPGRRKKG